MRGVIEKLKAKQACAAKGHDWHPDGTAWDCDGGMGGGQPIRVLKCARCGASGKSVFGSRTTEGVSAGA